MSNDASSTSHSSDGSTDASQSSDSDNSQKQSEVVPKSAFVGVTNDMHKWKKTAKDLESELASERQKREELEAKLGGGENDYKSLAEKYKKEAELNKVKADKLHEGYVYSEKFRTVYGELKKLGLKDEAEKYLEYEDFKDLEIETTSKGRVNVLGAKEWASEFQTKNKFLFDLKKAPGVHSTDGRNSQVSEGEITAAMVVEAERKAKKTGKAEDILDFKNKYDKYKKRRA